MKIAMLARNPNLYSHKRLQESAIERGHELDIINTTRCYMNIASRRPEIYYNGEILQRYDAVIPRIGASVTFYGTAVLRQFEVLKVAGGAPLVVKLLEGTQGIGVVLADTNRSAKSVVEAFRGANINILIQEFIKEAGGTDIRAFVVGGKVIAAMQRTGADDDFRSNLHRGGSAKVVKLSPEERSTAIRSAKSMGLNVCGVDMLRSNHGPVVMEVNSSPGLEGIEKATGIDIAGKVIEFIEKNAQPGKTRTKGKG